MFNLNWDIFNRHKEQTKQTPFSGIGGGRPTLSPQQSQGMLSGLDRTLWGGAMSIPGLGALFSAIRPSRFRNQPTRAIRPVAPSPRPAQTISGRAHPDPRALEQIAGLDRRDMFDELLSLQDPSRYMMDQDELQRQASAAASAQYDPLIAALRQAMGAAEETGQRHHGELGDMFGSLSRSIRDDIPEIQDMYEDTRSRTGKHFEDLESNIQDRYAKSQADQENMMKKLNIQAAAPDILPQQQADRDFFSQMAQERGSIADQAIGQEQRGATEFTRQGAQLARTEGTQRQGDLMTELRGILDAYQGQIGSHEAAKSHATTAGLGQLQQQMQQMASQRAQQDFQNRMSMLQFERQLSNDDFSRLQAQAQMQPEGFEGPLKGFGDLPDFLTNQGLDPNTASQVVALFQDTMGQPDFAMDPSGMVSRDKIDRANSIIAEARRRFGNNPAAMAAITRAAYEMIGGVR